MRRIKPLKYIHHSIFMYTHLLCCAYERYIFHQLMDHSLCLFESNFIYYVTNWQSLSDADHFVDGEHNSVYDHEAFLGDEATQFDELSPSESRRRLGWVWLIHLDFTSNFFLTSTLLIPLLFPSGRHVFCQINSKQQIKFFMVHIASSNSCRKHVGFRNLICLLARFQVYASSSILWPSFSCHTTDTHYKHPDMILKFVMYVVSGVSYGCMNH